MVVGHSLWPGREDGQAHHRPDVTSLNNATDTREPIEIRSSGELNRLVLPHFLPLQIYRSVDQTDF